jgi:hypothetical protein
MGRADDDTLRHRRMPLPKKAIRGVAARPDSDLTGKLPMVHAVAFSH